MRIQIKPTESTVVSLFEELMSTEVTLYSVSSTDEVVFDTHRDLLFKHLHLAAKFIEIGYFDGYTRDTWPFGNLTSYLVNLDQEELAFIKDMKSGFSSVRRSTNEASVLANAVSWLAAEDLYPSDLNPYQPIMEFFRMGGGFTTEHGVIYVHRYGVRMSPYEKWLKLRI